MEKPTTYYHGTHNFLETGTVLRGRGEQYVEDWSTLGLAYEIMESRRPAHLLAHRNAVFMCSLDVDNPDDTGLDNISICGGGTEFVSIVRPNGPVSRHDINQMSLAQHLIAEGECDIRDVYDAIDDYWNGIPSGDPLWEFLTPEAVVMETFDFLNYDPPEIPEEHEVVFMAERDMRLLVAEEENILTRLKYIIPHQDNQIYLGILDEGKLVSCLILERMSDEGSGKPCLAIQGISTDIDFQKRGFARKLLEKANEMAVRSAMPLVTSRYSEDGEKYIQPIVKQLLQSRTVSSHVPSI